MQNIELYIEGQRIDLFQDESVSLTQTIKNAKDVAKIFTSFTQTFNVPASKTNNKIFKHYYNFDIDGGFDARIKKNATIELNTYPFEKGKIKLEGVKLKENIAYSYNITFFGNTVDLKDIIGEDKLNVLTDLDSLNEIYSTTEVKSALQRDPTTNDVIVPLITHTDRLYFETSSNSGADGNLWYQSGHQHGVLWSQLKYALRIRKIVEAIESHYSNITFSNDFFTSTNLPYNNLFMWLHRKKGDVGFGAQLPTFFTTVNGWVSDSGDLATMVNTSTFRPTVPSDYNLDYLTLSLLRSNSIHYSITVLRNGVHTYSEDVTTANKFIQLGGQAFVNNSDYTVIIEHTEQITFTNIRWQITATEEGGGGQVNTFQTSDQGDFTVNAQIQFEITQQIPEIKVIDFLSGLFKMFNLVAYVNEAGTIVVQTLDDFYIEGTSYDISSYLDVNTSNVNVALPYKEIVFAYKDTKTFLAAVHNQLFNYTWAKESYNGNENLDGGIYKVELPFAHFKFERLLDLDDSSNTDVQWGYCVDDNQESYIGSPFLFYPIRQTNATQISFRDGLTTHSPITSYIVPSNSVALDDTTSRDNINFNNEVNEYDTDGDFTRTLFQKYYSNYITSIFNSKNRLTKVTAYLPLKILLNYTLADRFDINGRRYKINSINTNLKTGKSDIELLNDLTVYSNSIDNVQVQGQGALGSLYYKTFIGGVRNLIVGDIMYNDKDLKTFANATNYTQAGNNNDETRYCESSFVMNMVIGSNGVITSLTCTFVP
mgnify:CR=1 FL=1